jgi:uncharacterized tellurite resistance protein B-like protein
MGLFDRLTGNNHVELTPKSAIALAALTVIGIDGSVDDGEIDGLRRIVRGDDRSLQIASQIYKDKEVSECVPMVGAVLDDRQKVATLANLLDIAMADGLLAGAEQRLLETYVQAFGIDEDIVKELVDVIAIKNDFSIFDR